MAVWRNPVTVGPVSLKRAFNTLHETVADPWAVLEGKQCGLPNHSAVRERGDIVCAVATGRMMHDLIEKRNDAADKDADADRADGADDCALEIENDVQQKDDAEAEQSAARVSEQERGDEKTAESDARNSLLEESRVEKSDAAEQTQMTGRDHVSAKSRLQCAGDVIRAGVSETRRNG